MKEVLNFQIGKEKFYVRDLTIQDYYDLQHQLVMVDQESGMEVISRLSDCPIETLNKLKYEDWLALWTAVQQSIHQSITLDDKFSPKVEVNGIKYGIVDMDSISVGEFSDLDVILNSPNAEKRLHEALAVLYRPIIWESGNRYKIEEYTPEEYKERVEEFKAFPLSKARIAITFFLRSGSKSLKVMLDSLTTAMTQMKDPEMPDHLKVQVDQILTELQEAGLKLSLSYPVKIRLSLRKRVNLIFARLLIGLHGRLTRLKKRISKHRNNNQNIEA